jgi:hypothetical protein
MQRALARVNGGLLRSVPFSSDVIHILKAGLLRCSMLRNSPAAAGQRSRKLLPFAMQPATIDPSHMKQEINK